MKKMFIILLAAVMLVAMIPLTVNAADNTFNAVSYYPVTMGGVGINSGNGQLSALGLAIDSDGVLYFFCEAERNLSVNPEKLHYLNVKFNESDEPVQFEYGNGFDFAKYDGTLTINFPYVEGADPVVFPQKTKGGYVVLSFEPDDTITSSIFLSSDMASGGNGWHIGGSDGSMVEIELNVEYKITKNVIDEKEVYYPGDEIRYEIVANNTGDPVSNIDVYDGFPFDKLNLTSVTKDGENVSYTTDDKYLYIGKDLAFAKGQSRTYVVNATVKNDIPCNTEIVNTAFMGSETAIVTSSEVIKVPANPAFTVVNIDAAKKEKSKEDIYVSMKNFDGTYNVTKTVADNYLYGGLYTDETLGTAVSDLCGTSLAPKATDVFYVKNVPLDYIQPKVQYFYKGKDTICAYIFTILDDTNYKLAGYDIDGEEKWNTTVNENTVYSEINCITENGVTVKGVKYYSNTGIDKGCLVCYNLKDELNSLKSGNKTITIVPFYVTPDNVKVTGTVSKAVTFSETALPKGKNSDNTSTCAVYSEPAVAAAAPRMRLSAAPFAMMTYKVEKSEETPVIEETVEYVTVTKMICGEADVQTVEAGTFRDTIASPEVAGKRFAGWYLDSEYTVPADFDVIESDITLYAKFVSENYLKLNYETKKTGKSIKNVTFLYAADTANYEKFGFVITVNGEKQTVEAAPAKKFNSVSAEKLFDDMDKSDKVAFSTLNLAAFKSGDVISVYGYGVTADGTKVCGDSMTFVYNVSGFEIVK